MEGRDLLFDPLKDRPSAVNFAFVQLEARSIRLEKRYGAKDLPGQRWKLRNVANSVGDMPSQYRSLYIPFF